MKKILSLLIGLLFIFSCSSDSNVTKKASDRLNYKEGKRTTTEQYKDLVRSVVYKEYRATLKDFSDKLFFLEEENVPFFKNENDMLGWISENLSKTSFSNVLEVQSIFDDITQRYPEIIISNITLFEQIHQEVLAGEQDGSIFLLDLEIPIFDYAPITGGVEINNCGYDCINDAVACNRDADEEYAATLLISAGAWAIGGVLAGGTIMAVAAINHRNAVRACARTFNACYKGCGY